MNRARFIGLSSDGGCSKKASCGQLHSLLWDVGKRSSSAPIRMLSSDMPDTGLFKLPSPECVATVDDILPMIDDPALFGRIAVNHSLNDIYAALSGPHFALAILGVHSSLEATSPEISAMLTAATLELKSANTSLIGGHTLAHQSDLFLGFAVVGTELQFDPSNLCAPGDPIFLTKKLASLEF